MVKFSREELFVFVANLIGILIIALVFGGCSTKPPKTLKHCVYNNGEVICIQEQPEVYYPVEIPRTKY